MVLKFKIQVKKLKPARRSFPSERAGAKK